VYLVSTRLIAALIALIPIYLAALFASYLASQLIVTKFFTLSGGVYQHYFNLFLPPQDLLFSFVKAFLFVVAVVLIHCYYGYYASGGPAGVGVAVGRAVRSSIVAINIIDLFLSLALWGSTVTVRVTS
jgi:phospholipid/cholesterol/gamma-HCH transport system permease protein